MSNNKEFKSFEKRLTGILNSSSAAESWSDLLPLTKEINQLLEKKKTEFNFSQLSNKHILAKRLAQCLNPECPGGVHEVVLDIYSVLFENIIEKNETKLEDSLGVYCCGIFPFFSYASIQNKSKFIDQIINNCFLKLNTNELTLCLPGLLSSLIPGLDDNNDKTTQLIYQVFDKIKTKITPKIFYGEYWAILLRNKSLRPSGMKYLYEKIIKYSDMQNMDENKKNEIIENEYPDINILVVNSLCEVIEEKDIPTVRLGMDFVITRLPLTKENNILTDEAKIILIMSALKLLIKNEYSTTRRLNDWLLGVKGDEDFSTDDPDFKYKMDLIAQAFKNMLNSKNWKNFNILKDYIKIIDQLFSQQIEFIEFILPKIAYELILCFVNYWQVELNLSENAQQNETINKLKNFFAKDYNYVEFLWKSIANHLEDINSKNDIDFSNEEYFNQKKIETLINNILNPLKFCFLFIDLNSNIDRAKHYIPIVKNLLQLMTKIIINNRENIKRIRHIILVVLVFTKSLQEKTSNNEILRNSSSADSSRIVLNESVIRKPSLFLQLNEEMDKTDVNEIYFILEETLYSNLIKNIDENTLKNFTEAIKNYQKFYINLLIKLFEFPKDSQIEKNEIKIFKHSTELMIRLQEYAQDTEIPEWMGYLQKIIFNSNVKLALEAVDCLINLNLSFYNEKEIYNKIKENFLSEKIGDRGIIDENELNNVIKKTGVNDNCHELLIGKLYTMLNEQSYQKRCIDLLVKISKIDEKKFITILTNTFSIKDSTEESVKLFSNFWKLLNENYSNNNYFKNGECLFQMVDYLDDNNPLLRHLSKSWLDQSSKQFNKILDPLILVFLDPNIKFTENNNMNYIIEKEYDIPKIMSIFHKLKSVILNSNIMNYIEENNPDVKILDIFNNHKQYQLMDNISDSYLNILIAISLKFTQGQCTENLSPDFQKNNHSINATSCEFLEFLLSRVNNIELLMKFANNINLPVLILLDKAIENNNEVMQVQLLSVLKVLYFSTINIHSKYKEDAFKLFGNESLINCLTKGMTSDYFFVRENFINFAQQCFPLLKKVLDNTQSKKHYYNIGAKFTFELITYLSKRIKIDRKGRKDTERFSHFDVKNNVNSIIYKNYLEEYKEYKIFDESDVLLLLKGIKEVVLHFICNNNRLIANNFNGSWTDFKKNLLEENKSSSGFLFGIFGGDSEKNNLNEMQMNLFKQQIFNLLNGLLLTWVNRSDKYEPYDYCLNPNGILPQKTVNKLLFSDGDIKEGINSVNNNPIKKLLREIGLNLFTTNSVEFIETIISIWCEGNIFKLKPIDVCMDLQYKITVIEFLISLNIPLNIILYCVNIILQKKIKNEPAKKKYIKDPKIKNFKTPYKTGLYEAKLCHFLYSYISLNPFINSDYVSYDDPSKYEVIESWKEMINLVTTLMNDTKIIYTFSWLYELLDLTLQKFPINKIENSDIKSSLIEIFTFITNKLTDSVFNDKTDSKIIGDKNLLILPILPHVYINMLQEVEICGEKVSYLYNKGGENSLNQVESNPNNNNTNNNNTNSENNNSDNTNTNNNENIEKLLPKISGRVYDFYSVYYSTAKICSDTTDKSFTTNPPMKLLNDTYRKLSFITLKENFFHILYNIYGDLNYLQKYITDILKRLINTIKLDPQEKKDDDESDNKVFFAEYSSDFLLSLMKDSRELVTNCGKSIFMEYLNSSNFFTTTPIILRNFRRLISLSVEYYPEMLNDLIKNINNGFLFLKGSDEDKMKTLRRVSFVIYSCEKDTFQKDFDVIKAKAKDFLSGYSDNSKLEGEIFLMMRILFLRFSHEGVMKMIKDLWPIIFTELIQNIQNESRNKHVNVLIESFKFIELLSLANVEEFSLYQWIFILDTFDMKNLDTRNPESLLSILLKNESKIFKPIAVDVLKGGDMSVTDEMLEGKHKSKSELFVCPENESIEDLRKSVKRFFYAIGDMNKYKVDINYEQIEDVIEKDFIQDINKK